MIKLFGVIFFNVLSFKVSEYQIRVHKYMFVSFRLQSMVMPKYLTFSADSQSYHLYKCLGLRVV